MIIKYPNKILLSPSEDVSLEEGNEIITKLREEAGLLTWGDVVGLAAPQIGINKNVFMALDKFYINPKIIARSEDKEMKEEGCYSLQENKFDYLIVRHKKIEMEWMSKKGRMTKNFFEGFEAQVLQHEYDHLLGKLCCGI